MNNIILIGMPGCGKTTIGRALAKSLGRSFFDVDQVLEDISGQTISELFAEGEEVFREVESETIVYLASKVRSVIATGGGVVTKEENMLVLRESGCLIFLNRSPEQIIKDLDITTRPLLSEGKEKIYNIYAKRIELYRKYADYEVGCGVEWGSILPEILAIVKEVGV
ncbi:MAG: shikimate kinase [Acidaminococcaceae bacterium]|nr:shikimate kinase [Acidaminococcaceae bacterium]